MSLYDLSEFFRLSAALNYNLSAESLNRYNVLMFLIGGKPLDSDEEKDRSKKSILMEALNYLFNAYQQKRRRLGPMAVLHPLRSTALLVRSLKAPRMIDILTSLFHDILEDIKTSDFDKTRWRALEEQVYRLMERLDEKTEDALIDRLFFLTRKDKESYYHYIERLLDGAIDAPQLVQTKLADRLDNTLDMRIDLEDPLKGVDFFQNIFQMLFVNTYHGYTPRMSHPPPAAIRGERRLFQLFKNVVLLSLVRQKPGIADDATSQTLFNAICEASLKEAQRSYVHLVGYHHTDMASQRALLLDAMRYCYSGKSEIVTRPDDHQLLDGLFSTYFGHTSKKIREERLEILYRNKPLMMQASIAFIVIFLSFMNDPGFFVHGISPDGVHFG
jgi:hypothetical protein